MPGPLTLFYRLRIRNAGNTADQITITSVRAGANPYLAGPPRGDGASYNPLTGESMLGSYTVQVLDWPNPGSTPTQRIITAQLEDTSLRQQLAYRACVLEQGTDGVTFPTVMISGVLSLLKLVDAMTYEATIQDPMRAMEQSTVFSPSSSMTLAAWFAQWPYRGCLAGGPLMTPAGSGGVGPLGIQDLGGWEMKVDGALKSDQFGSQYYVLRPSVVYGPPKWIANKKSNLNDFADLINRAAAAFQTVRFDGRNDAWTTINDAMVNAYCWSGITWLIDTGSGPVAWKPYPFDQFVIIDNDGNFHFNQSLLSNFNGNWGMAVMPAGGQSLAAGALVKVRALTVLPTDQCPLYLSGNPMDLLAKLWGSIPNLLWDQAALDAFKNTDPIGGMVMTFRITSAMKLTDLVNQIVQPLGLGIRGDSQGRLQVFDGRLGSANTIPGVTIGAADVIDGSTSLPFELDPSLAAKVITFTQSRFTDQRAAPFSNDVQVVDGVVVGTDALTMTNGDAGALPYGSLDWRTDGMISAASTPATTRPFIWQDFVTTLARRIFDRFGRGGIGFETTLLRGGAGDALNLGDEALINLPQVPNHNYRLGDNLAIAARRMQITRRTVLPEGYAVRFDDSGPNLQPLPTVPVLTIAASTDAPRTVAVVTFSNAGTLNGLGYGARLQWAVTSGAAPTAGQWTDVVAFNPGAIAAGGYRVPPALTGTTVFARARSELAPNLPSNYGAVVSLVLSSIAPPTGLAVTPNATDGSLETLTWTPGAGTAGDLTDIWLRSGGTAFALATRIQVLNAGSNQYVIEGLIPGSGYIVSVQHRDPRSGDVSAPIDLSFVAGAITRTLSAPVNPVGWSGSVDPKTGVPNRDGTYGIAVLAAEIPGYLEVQIAVETAVGSGAYGAMFTEARAPAIPSVQGNWTKAGFVAPNDGLRRKLQARHVLGGCTPSAYCDPVIVLPWTPQSIGPLPTNIIVEITVLPPSPITDAGNILRFQLAAIDPYGQTTQVAVQALSGTGVAIVSGPALTVLSPNDTIWKVSLPPTGAGPGMMTARGQALDGRKTDLVIVLPETTVPGMPQGTVGVDKDGNWQATIDLPSTVHSVRYGFSTSHFPTIAEVNASGWFQGPVTTPLDVTSAVYGFVLTFAQTIYMTVIPFTGSAGDGTQLAPIHVRGAYLGYTSSKTANYSPSGYIERTNPPWGTTYDSSMNVIMLSNLSTSQVQILNLDPIVPSGTTGVTIVQVAADLYDAGGIGGVIELTMFFSRHGIGAVGAVNLGNVDTAHGLGWQTLTLALSENTAGRSYQFEIQRNGGSAGSAGAGNCAITYTMPDPKQTL